MENKTHYNDLAPYAVLNTRGRVYEEPISDLSKLIEIRDRSDFQKDRDRIIHSTSFRRLAYKTQVFLNNGDGGLFRNRLTHSLEVSQIGRSLAYALKVNSDLVEAICLAHDLGHTPFGHCGQDVLNQCLKQYNDSRFEHNMQSLRIVDKLEKRYVAYDGLNLCFETREGILKHCSYNLQQKLSTDLSFRFINKKSPSLEAQIANIADEIAYNHHDLDDGLRAGIINMNQLVESLPYVKTYYLKIKQQYQNLDINLFRKELIRNLLNDTVVSLLISSNNNIKQAKVKSINDVRDSAELIKYDELMLKQQKSLKKFLMDSLYRHPQVMAVRINNAQLITDIFNYLISNPTQLPKLYYERIKNSPARAVADYISGMTDKFALDFLIDK